ncbi:MAG: PfkB family carbohydrate kinase [Anaerolineae bacterium]
MTASTYLVIGHVTLDTANGGYVPGGTATYSAVTAARLGMTTRVLTACDSVGREAAASLAAIGDVAWVESPVTTAFTNVYLAGGRRQRLLASARALVPADMPLSWLASDVAHLGPVDQEVDEAFLSLFGEDTTVGVTPQGWLRTWDAEGNVGPKPWRPSPASLARVSAIVLSEEDVGPHRDLIDYYAEHCPVVVVTYGYRGCVLRLRGERVALPTRPAPEVDPTGAGDVFATAFFIRLHETGNPVAAARFANVVGSFSVQGPGVAAIPTRETVDDWLAENPER